MKSVCALIALLFTTTAFALPTFNPQLVLKNQQGETSINAIQPGTNFAAAFKSTTVTLTAAQVIALPGTPISLIPAQAGFVIQVVAVEFAYVKGASAFTIGSSKSLIVQYITSDVLINKIGTTGLLDSSSSKTGFAFGAGLGAVSVGGQGVEITSDDTTPVSGGTGSTVAVTVFYNLIKVL